MANDLTTRKPTMPANYTPVSMDDLSSGLSGGFGVISFRGSKWRIKFGGNEELITDDEGEARASIPVVLVQAAPHVSKIFYKKNYEEGDDQSPDCYSLDGVRPDPAAPAKQAKECATCPMNQWGSRVSEAGKKAKRCSDHRRVAVVPAALKGEHADPEVLMNEEFGGPMLLRVPPASLDDLAKFGRELARRHAGLPYNHVVVRVGFDPETAYPKLTFKAVRKLSADEIAVVETFRADGSVDKVLAVDIAFDGDVVEAKPATKPRAVDTDFEEEEEPEKPVKQTRAKTKTKAAPVEEDDELEAAPVETKPKAKTKAKPKPKETAPVDDDDDGYMSSLQEAMDDLGLD